MATTPGRISATYSWNKSRGQESWDSSPSHGGLGAFQFLKVYRPLSLIVALSRYNLGDVTRRAWEFVPQL